MVHHLPELIYDLAIILVAAALVTIVFRAIKQPVVLGYIIAGLLVGPHIHFFPTIGDLPSVKTWAEIGVIFLLFGLGLEFSFKKLASVGGASGVTAVFEAISMVLIGYATGWLFGWSHMDSLFLGGILAISSTTIIIRAFEEVGVKRRRFASLVFGVLVIEDLVAILLLVLLSTLALSNQFEGLQMVSAVFKLLFFLALWLLSGIFLVPSLLRRCRPILNDETLLVFALGLCFLMVVLATEVGFSPALGAFVMGSVFAETMDAERIEHLVMPVKDLFAAIFFVSVGTMIDPGTLVAYAGPVAAITCVTIFGKILSTMFGAILAGQSLRHSVQAGFSLAQIGEFSFIIAGLGLTLKVTSDFLYPVAIAVSAITTFSTPYLIRSADRAYELLERRLPERWLKALAAYSSAAQGVSRTGEWRELLKLYFFRISINAVLVSAIFILVAKFLPGYLSAFIEDKKVINGLSLLVALVASSPFLWAWLLSQPGRVQISHLWSVNQQRGLRHRGPILMLEALRFGSAILVFAVLAPQLVSIGTALLITALWAAAVLLLFSRYWQAIYAWLEGRFITNLTERELMHAQAATPPLAPWDAHIAKMNVAPESDAVGKSLAESQIRERYGVTIALIERGKRLITAPMRNEVLYPHDRLSVIGSDEQIARFHAYIEKRPEPDHASRVDSRRYSLHRIEIMPGSRFQGRTIKDSGIREETHGLVVGIERGNDRVLNPDSTRMIETGDRLWIVGDQDLIERLNGAT